MLVNFNIRGNFEVTIGWLNDMQNIEAYDTLSTIGEYIVKRLQDYTPVDTGELRDSWSYEITKEKGNYVLSILNDAHRDAVDGLVYMLEYGHGTGTGGWVAPTHFVTNAMDGVDLFINDVIGGLLNG